MAQGKNTRVQGSHNRGDVWLGLQVVIRPLQGFLKVLWTATVKPESLLADFPHTRLSQSCQRQSLPRSSVYPL